MARRDMLTTINHVKGVIPNEYDMCASEMIQLSKIAKENPIEAIGLAFYYGYAMGGRAAKADKYRERP